MKKICFALALLVLSYCVVSETDAGTWYVKVDGTGDAPTIQAALDSCINGDTVLVAPGTYLQPAITFWEKDSLTIMSEEGANATFLHLDGISVIMLASGTNGITIKGFTFEDSQGSGLGIDWCTHVVITENIFRHNQQYALLISTSGFVTVTYNLFCSNRDGIRCTDETNYIVISNNTISYNNIIAGEEIGSGINLDTVGSYDISNNIITHNRYGILTRALFITFTCNNVFNNEFNYDLNPSMPDPTGTNGNISFFVQFCGTNPDVSGNFYLQSDSPCAPGNHPTGYECGLIGRFPVNCGTTDARMESWGRIKNEGIP
jgi:hypothetical protein